ncbi:MAG: exodeoxyribonuclease VII small subunit [Candidatus Gygaella obscura]|nr:exodeoxyribonuclease VII small subunit [Candidatus Gygaella obscura]
MAQEKFEDSLKRLERIVAELEAGKLSLDDALKKYEEGVKISRDCSKLLEAAQKKISILSKREPAGFDLEEEKD